jgi:hypothetical protein
VLVAPTWILKRFAFFNCAIGIFIKVMKRVCDSSVSGRIECRLVPGALTGPYIAPFHVSGECYPFFHEYDVRSEFALANYLIYRNFFVHPQNVYLQFDMRLEAGVQRFCVDTIPADVFYTLEVSVTGSMTFNNATRIFESLDGVGAMRIISYDARILSSITFNKLTSANRQFWAVSEKITLV